MKFKDYLCKTLITILSLIQIGHASHNLNFDYLELKSINDVPLIDLYKDNINVDIRLASDKHCIELTTKSGCLLQEKHILTPFVQNVYHDGYQALKKNKQIYEYTRHRDAQNIIDFYGEKLSLNSCESTVAYDAKYHHTAFVNVDNPDETNDLVFTGTVLNFKMNYIATASLSNKIILRPPNSFDCPLSEIVITPKSLPIFIDGMVNFKTLKFKKLFITHSDICLKFGSQKHEDIFTSLQ